jgi:hypothetical protein
VITAKASGAGGVTKRGWPMSDDRDRTVATATVTKAVRAGTEIRTSTEAV